MWYAFCHFVYVVDIDDAAGTYVGTPDYLAPEIVQSRGYNKSVDWYALGVLMFEMLVRLVFPLVFPPFLAQLSNATLSDNRSQAGYPPFFTEDTNPMRLYEKIIQNKVRYPSYFTSPAISLLRSLLTADLSKRFGNLARGSTDIFSHEWFQEVDWETLYRKEIPAPYVPKIEGEWDSSNFDTYSEIDVSEYGKEGVDGHRALFLAF
jgi:protein kinase A